MMTTTISETQESSTLPPETTETLTTQDVPESTGPVEQTVPPTEPYVPPGGKDPEVPPVPQVPGNTVVPGNDGEFFEFDPDGTPLGTWHYDPLEEEWVYEEYPPTSDLPMTAGQTLSNGLPLGFMFLLVGLGTAHNPRSRKIRR
jgi:hypothetical protein